MRDSSSCSTDELIDVPKGTMAFSKRETLALFAFLLILVTSFVKPALMAGQTISTTPPDRGVSPAKACTSPHTQEEYTAEDRRT